MRIKRFYESTDSYKEFNLEDECRHILDNDSNCWVEENSFVTLNKKLEYISSLCRNIKD